jgi:3-keto-5-aminohexanoate cleavage enzyme
MKKIINFTPTGIQPTRGNSLAPLTAAEIVEDVQCAYEEGITLVHIHARDENLDNSYKAIHYRPVLEGIRKYCPGLAICVSLSGRVFAEFEKRTEVLELEPDMGSLTMSSLNFASGASPNSPDMILKLIEKMHTCGVIPEIECFDSGMINYAKYLMAKGILKAPFYFNVILGNMFNAQADLASVAAVTAMLPKDAKVCFGGIGKEQLKANMLGLLYADGLRIGLEDNFYFTDQNKATNIQLLTRIHNIMREAEIEMMHPAEFQSLGFLNTHAKQKQSVVAPK